MAVENGKSSMHPERVDLFSSTPESTATIGKKYASWISGYLHQSGAVLPREGQYLALAAGAGYAELALASELGIPTNNVTLLDDQFSEQVVQRFMRDYRGLNVVYADLFTYFLRVPKRKFQIVSAFGIETALHQERNMLELISSMHHLLKENGLACVCPYFGNDLKDIWEAYGFKEIRGHTGVNSALLYRRE